MNVNDLDIAENNTKFFLSMWSEEEIIIIYKRLFEQMLCKWFFFFLV